MKLALRHAGTLSLLVAVLALSFMGNSAAESIPVEIAYTQTQFGTQFYGASTWSEPITNWSWSFGDGFGATSQNPLHAYSCKGTYTVLLQLTDDQGNSGSSSGKITVPEDRVTCGDIPTSNPDLFTGPENPIPLGLYVVLGFVLLITFALTALFLGMEVKWHRKELLSKRILKVLLVLSLVGLVLVADASGPQLLEGVPGSRGHEGPAGGQGPAGTNGTIGAEGPQGPEGPEGPEGPPGADGDPGPAGEDGAPGAAGADGYNSLVKLTAEAPGANCLLGGVKVQSGLDNGAGGGTARDGILQAGEVTVTTYACDGEDGFNLLVDLNTEPPGVHCDFGGVIIDMGLDDGIPSGTARNDVLEAGEISDTDYACNGDEGYVSLILVTTESPGANCAVGGKKFQTGVDNGDGGGTARDLTLQAGEVDATNYVCTGATGATGSAGAAGTDGFTSLILVSAESAGANCAFAGKKVQTGLDNGDGGGTARDGTLQAGEVDATNYVCNGSDGYNSLVNTASEGAGANCAAGGFKVTSGLDNGDGGGTARDGVLAAGEVDQTTYICSGTVKSLITAVTEAQGANCGISGGGYKITSGMDNGDGGGTALDGTLQAGEVDATTYTCFGGPGGGKMLFFESKGGSTAGTSTQWTNMPAALTELYGRTSQRIQANLTAFTEVRFGVSTWVAGTAASFLLLQYSTNNASSWSNACGAQCPEVNTGAVGSAWTAWQTMNSTMKADVLLRVVGSQGDAAADPSFSIVYAEFR